MSGSVDTAGAVGSRRRLLRWGAVAMAVAAAAGLGRAAWRARRERASLRQRLAGIQPLPASAGTDCAAVKAVRPLVLLALGQSNAANHGSAAPSLAAPVTVLHRGRCAWAADPLPGGTGSGGSIWSRLPAQLASLGLSRPVVLAVLAVDATALADWTDEDSPLRAELLATLAANAAAGLPPDLVLWQQGEADARTGATTSAHVQGLRTLAGLLATGGSRAPILLAQSTVCRSAPHAGVREAVRLLLAEDARFVAGPDTDLQIPAALRHDGCHLNADGLDRAALLWAQAIVRSTVAGAPRHMLDLADRLPATDNPPFAVTAAAAAAALPPPRRGAAGPPDRLSSPCPGCTA